MTYEEQIQHFLDNPSELIKKKPFTRGMDSIIDPFDGTDTARAGERLDARLPDFERKIVDQSTFMKELDPACHKVLFDENIPSITAKTDDGHFYEIEFRKMSIPFQKMIVKKHVRFLCGYPMQFSLNNNEPSEAQSTDYATFKKKWKERNQDGMRTKLVTTQKSLGDGGLLYYFDRWGQIKCRLISYEDGYVICSHDDDNGDRLAECLYYRTGDSQFIDCFTDFEQIRFTRNVTKGQEWSLVFRKPHGFNEIPLVTKRGNVAWNDVQDTIDVYEIIYNIFLVIQKRHGWGLLYIKGTFSEKAKKIAGAVVLNDASLNKDGSAQYLTPPTPQGMLDTLKLMEETIQKGSGTTFILPKDITTGGDISGVAIQITQSLDNEEALGGVIEWQNVASKMMRLFKYGLSKEMVNNGDSTAITRFDSLDITATFKQWRPRNDSEYNQMLSTLKGSGLISKKTGVELNTESAPDEEFRLASELEEQLEMEARIETSVNAPENIEE